MKQIVQRLLSDARGNVMLLMGLGITTLVAAAGVGVDIGLQQMTKVKLQQALDASALAAATITPNPDAGQDAINRQNAALNFYNVNFPASFMGVARPNANVSVNVAAQTISMSVETTVPMRFLGLIGVPGIATTASTSVAISTVAPPSQDVIMVLDVSGSMNFKDASGSGNLDPDPGAPCVTTFGTGPVVPSDCLGDTRLNALRGAADRLATKLLNPNTNNHRIGMVSWSSNVVSQQALTSDYTSVRAFLGQMFAAGMTNSTSGMAAAQAMGNSSFRPGVVRAVILLTDGVNAMPAQDFTTINPATLAVCSAMKAAGTVVYTVAFGNNAVGDTTVLNFLGQCASGDPVNNRGQYFYVAPDSSVLSDAFNDIFANIRKIRLTQ